MTDVLKEKYLQQFNFDGIKLDVDLLFAPYPGVTRSVQGLLTLKVGNIFDPNKRCGLNIALVLDVSGSMEGKKLKESKNAIKYMFDNMIESDLYHLIIYSDKASVVSERITVNNREAVIRDLHNIKAQGCTNLYEGYKLGVDTALKYTKKYQDTSSVFLFSDGQITDGEKDIQKISNFVADVLTKNIRSTTFGIGEDHDEKLMSQISRSGGSDFHYIDTAERIPVLIKKAVRSAQSILTDQGTLRMCGTGGVCIDITACGTKSKSQNGWYRFGVVREHAIINIPFDLSFIGSLDSPQIYIELDMIHKATQPVNLINRDIDYGAVNDRKRFIIVKPVTLSSFAAWQKEDIKTNHRVESYYLLDEVTKLDKKIADMITSNRPIQEIIDAEQQILTQLEPIMVMDDTLIAQALYEKTKTKIDQHIQNKRLTEHDKKNACYVANRYEMNEEEDGDMGFGLFD